MIKEEFRDIAPYEDSEFTKKMNELIKEPGFEHAVKWVMPDVDYPEFAAELLKVTTKHEFQTKIMLSFLNLLVMKTTSGITMNGFDTLGTSMCYTFITNHRDIVLDASFLNLCLIKNGLPTCEVALGNNLLIYDWIEDLVKLNKSFIVKRNLKLTKALEAARQLSGYIHFCIEEKNESVWIAQREGRAKDSNDRTQESLIKMLALAGDGSVLDNLLAINLNPTSISYEYDACDYLKAQEYLNRRRDPDFKKSERDDLLSMETGILGFKGRVHFNTGKCINPELEKLRDITDKNELIKKIAEIIDRTIHRGYKIYPGNFIAYDIVNSTSQFTDHYTAEDIEKFHAYLDRQLNKVEIKDVTPEERSYMKDMMLTMYANPLRNKLEAGAEIENA